MKTQPNKYEAILAFVEKNSKCDNAQIVKGTGLGRETVRLATIKLCEEGKILFESIQVGSNTKKVFSIITTHSEKPVSQDSIKEHVKLVQYVNSTSKKQKSPAIVQTSSGLGFMYENEPTVLVKQGIMNVPKVMIHLINEDMTPILHNGSQKKILVALDKINIVTPAKEVKKIKVKREKKAKTENSTKDFSKYQFNGNVYTKGRLVHAIIAAYVQEHKPTFAELKAAFPDEKIRPYGRLFDTIDNTQIESKLKRFFNKEADIIKVKGGKIAVTNQVDGSLVDRLLAYTSSFGYSIETVLKPIDAIV